jgi:hypothetical protein
MTEFAYSLLSNDLKCVLMIITYYICGMRPPMLIFIRNLIYIFYIYNIINMSIEY